MLTIFYSYCHDEENYLTDLRKQVAPLIDKEDITEWWDRKIRAGESLSVIQEQLNSSDIVLLFISPGYLASESCKKEMALAWRRYEEDDIQVIPVIIRRCGWKDHPTLPQRLAIPTDGKPIEEWTIQGQAWEVIRNELRDSIQREQSKRTRRHAPKSAFRRGIGQVAFVQKNRSDIDIDQIFVFPHLTSEQGDHHTRIANFADLIRQNAPTILVGEQQSGKTTLARKLWMYTWEHDRGALLIDGQQLHSSRPARVIRQAFSQHIEGNLSTWMEKDGAALIVDNAGTILTAPFCEELEEKFKRVIYTMTDEDYFEKLESNAEVGKYRVVRIRTLTHGQQERLVQNWLNIRPASDIASERHQEVDDMEDHVNSIIDRDRIVPRYPFFVLSILQTREDFMPQQLRITAYAHCYQALIVAHLCTSGVKSTEIDAAMNILTQLAHLIFRNRRNGSKTTKADFIEGYRNEYVFSLRMFEKMERGAGVLSVDEDGCIGFTYNFGYYFFVGKALGETYEENKKVIETMAEHSYRASNAHTLLFLLHHSRSQDLLETILLHTMETLGNTPNAKLDETDTRNLAKALKSVPRTLPGKTLHEAREEERTGRDSADARELERAKEIEDGQPSNIYRALRNMEILGQVLRNQYGSLTRERLREVIAGIIDTGLQLIHTFTNEDAHVRHEQQLREYFSRKYSTKLKDSSGEILDTLRISKSVSRLLRAMAILTIVVLLGKIVSCIWRRELLSIVQDLCCETEDPAHSAIRAVFEMATKEQLDIDVSELIADVHAQFVHERNTVMARTLSLLVQQYMRTHDAPLSVRQKLSHSIGIPYRPTKPRKER